MASKEWFRSWFASPWYPVLYQNRDEDEARHFITRLLDFLKPAPGARMVDIACGEGRYAHQLALAGYEVAGIDLSSASIQKAKALETAHLDFFVHDMRLPFFTNYFDFAFNFFTSFGYFTHRKDNNLAARSFAAALRPGGLLVVDYLNTAASIKKLVPAETVTRGGVSFHLKRSVQQGYFLKHISFTDPQGGHHEYSERVAAFTLDDFREIFEKTGMLLQHTFGNYNLDPFNEETAPRLIMVFKKALA